MLRTRGGALVTVLAGFLSAAFAAGGDLREAADPGLQARLEQVVAAQGLAKPVSNQHLALALVDLSSPARPRLAMLNGDSMLYAASLPKIAILLGAFVEAERGHLLHDLHRVALFPVVVRHVRKDLLLGELPDERLVASLLLGQGEVHAVLRISRGDGTGRACAARRSGRGRS